MAIKRKPGDIARDARSQLDLSLQITQDLNNNLYKMNEELAQGGQFWGKISDKLMKVVDDAEKLGDFNEDMLKNIQKLNREYETLQKVHKKIIDYGKKWGFSQDVAKLIASGHKIDNVFVSLGKRVRDSTQAFFLFHSKVGLTHHAVRGLTQSFKLFGVGLKWIGMLAAAAAGVVSIVLGKSLYTVSHILSTIGGALEKTVLGALTSLGEVAKFAFVGTNDVFKLIVESMSALFMRVVGMPQVVADGMKELWKLFTGTFDDIVELGTQTIETISSSLVAIGKTILSNVLNPFQLIQGIVSNLADSVGNILANAFKSAANIIKGALETVLNLTKMTISAYFSLLTFFWDQTTHMSAGASELRQKIEELRKEYGNLERAQGKVAIDMRRKLGWSFRMFHMNLAETQAMVNDFMKALGPTSNAIISQFDKTDRAITKTFFHLVKGLDLSEEATQAVAVQSLASGDKMIDVYRGITDATQAMGKAFKMSAKIIGRNVGEMIVDIATFGSLTIKQMTVAATRALSLGVEIKKLAGIMKAFDTFKDAASNVALLNQAFGTQLDTLKLMREEDPTKRIDMVRKALDAQGKSTENMTRREMMLLAQTTNLDEQTAKAVFSMKNRGKTQEQIGKEMERAGKKERTDQDRVRDLRKEIERLVKSGQEITNVWDALSQGVSWGIRWWAWQEGILRSVNRGLRQLRWIARDVTLDFLKNSKFFQGFAKTVRETFDTFREKAEQFRSMFSGFLRGNFGVEELINKFVSQFSAGVRQGWKDILEGVKTGFGIFASWVLDAIGTITDSILKGVVSLLKGGFSELAGGGWYKPIIDIIKKWGPRLAASFVEIGQIIGAKVKSWWDESIFPWLRQMGQKIYDWGLILYHEKIAPFLDKWVGGIIDKFNNLWKKLKAFINWFGKEFISVFGHSIKNWHLVIAGALFGPAMFQAALGLFSKTIVGIFTNSKIMAALSGVGKAWGVGLLKGISGILGIGLQAYAGIVEAGGATTKKDQYRAQGGAIGGIIVGTVGAILGGPIGAAIGAGIGQFMGRMAGEEMSGWFEDERDRNLRELEKRYEQYDRKTENMAKAHAAVMDGLNQKIEQLDTTVSLANKEFDLNKAYFHTFSETVRDLGGSFKNLDKEGAAKLKEQMGRAGINSNIFASALDDLITKGVRESEIAHLGFAEVLKTLASKEEEIRLKEQAQRKLSMDLERLALEKELLPEKVKQADKDWANKKASWQDEEKRAIGQLAALERERDRISAGSWLAGKGTKQLIAKQLAPIEEQIRYYEGRKIAAIISANTDFQLYTDRKKELENNAINLNQKEIDLKSDMLAVYDKQVVNGQLLNAKDAQLVKDKIEVQEKEKQLYKDVIGKIIAGKNALASIQNAAGTMLAFVALKREIKEKGLKGAIVDPVKNFVSGVRSFMSTAIASLPTSPRAGLSPEVQAMTDQYGISPADLILDKDLESRIKKLPQLIPALDAFVKSLGKFAENMLADKESQKNIKEAVNALSVPFAALNTIAAPAAALSDSLGSFGSNYKSFARNLETISTKTIYKYGVAIETFGANLGNFANQLENINIGKVEKVLEVIKTGKANFDIIKTGKGEFVLFDSKGEGKQLKLDLTVQLAIAKNEYEASLKELGVQLVKTTGK